MILKISTDGVYGSHTERAVRLAQRRNGVYPPDGIAGPVTMAVLDVTARPQTKNGTKNGSTPALNQQGKGDPGPLKQTVDPPRNQAKQNSMPDGTFNNVLSMRTSFNGRLFIIRRECWKGVSNHLHHPSAGSGVTIGPGYDMKDRSETDIQQDLAIIGIPADAAASAAKGAHLTGAAADKFVKDNHKLLNLTDEQEAALLAHILPKYQDRVKHSITVPLHQYEFDALVSFAYNPGGAWHAVTTFVNQKKYHQAMLAISQQVYSKHQKLNGLVDRRKREVNLFLYGDYQ